MHREPNGATTRPLTGGPKKTGSAAAPAVTTVLIVADRELVRAGLRGLLQGIGGFSVVAEVPTAAEARMALRGSPAMLVLADGGSDRTDAIQLAHAVGPTEQPPAIVLMVADGDFDLVAAAVRAGIRGVVLPDVSGAELAVVIEHAVAGEHAIEASLATRLLVSMAGTGQDHPPDPLTPREMEILAMISRGHTNREIASQTFSAVGTVKVHVEHILQKLGVVDRTQAAVRGMELGLVHAADGVDAGNDGGEPRWRRPGSADPSRMA